MRHLFTQFSNSVFRTIYINAILIFFSLLVFEIFFGIFFILRPNPTISVIFKPFINYDKVKILSRTEHYDYETNKYKPGKYKTEKINYEINSDGFRGPEIKDDFIKKCIGISYGGSTTIGLQSIYKDTYPKILEDQLNKKNKDCRILNAGVSAKSLKYIFSRAVKEVGDYKPNFISIYNNRNSAMYDATTSPIKNDIVKNQFNLTVFKVTLFLENNIMIYKFLKKIILILSETKYGTPHPMDPSRSININYFEKEYFNLLDQIYTLATKNKTKLVLVKQVYYINPLLQNKLESNTIKKNINLLKEYNELNLENESYETLDDEKKFDNYFMITNAILNQQFDNLKKIHNDIMVVDVLNIFYAYEKNEVTTDGLHLTKKGNEIIANGMFKSLESKINP